MGLNKEFVFQAMEKLISKSVTEKEMTGPFSHSTMAVSN